MTLVHVPRTLVAVGHRYQVGERAHHARRAQLQVSRLAEDDFIRLDGYPEVKLLHRPDQLLAARRQVDHAPHHPVLRREHEDARVLTAEVVGHARVLSPAVELRDVRYLRELADLRWMRKMAVNWNHREVFDSSRVQ